MDALTLLKEKYKLPDPPPEPGAIEPDPCLDAGPMPDPATLVSTRPPATWRDSVTVVALADYMATRPWARLGTYAAGNVGIRFDPGITPADADRWAEACRAWSMLWDALVDLNYLTSRGLLTLPVIEAAPVIRPPPRRRHRR